MSDEADGISLGIARQWCSERGTDWRVLDQAGRGGTAPVYTVQSPEGLLALKIYDETFSSGFIGQLEKKRIDQQIALGRHSCPYLIQVLDGGTYAGRHFILMNRAHGKELEKRLKDVPRSEIRNIVGQVAQALLFLREHNLCHRDLKSANIFISDDFRHATVLDLSVMRDIHDPVGIGTDQDGRLPVVATARYSPPEYLFRLIDPSPQLWHALDIYQLGGLLHDLIMRQPLFDEEFRASKDNRYRFAWLVATQDPIVQANDVDPSLIFLARRALDKDWQRRSTLEIAEFLSDDEAAQRRALSMLGLLPTIERPPTHGPSISETRSLLASIAQSLETIFVEHLRKFGLIAVHRCRPGASDLEQLIELDWETRESAIDVPAQNRIGILLKGQTTPAGDVVQASMRLERLHTGAEHFAEIALPTEPLGQSTGEKLFASAVPALAELALKLRTKN